MDANSLEFYVQAICAVDMIPPRGYHEEYETRSEEQTYQKTQDY